MSTVVSFNGKKIIEPGVYSQIKSGIPAKPSNFSFGNLMIIDTGSGKGFGGGSGINGTFANGLNSVYAFDDVDDFKGFVKGGLLWDLADYIFNPLNGASGPETVYIGRAANTTPAEIDLAFVGGGANGGTLKLLAKNEGETGNGLKDEILAKGTVRVDPTTIVIGDSFEISVNGVVIAQNDMTTVSTSQEFAAIIDIINNGVSGYTAKMQGSDLIIYAPKKDFLTSGLDNKSVPVPEILFWVGCSGSFDDRAKKITKAVAKILNKVEMNFAHGWR